MAVVERIYGARIRVYEWKEEFCGDAFSESEGLVFLLRAYSGTSTGVEELPEFTVKKFDVFKFNLEHLLYPDSLQSLFDRPILSTKFFSQDSNALALSEAMFTHLVSKFQFTCMLNSFPSRKSKIVIVVDVFVMITKSSLVEKDFNLDNKEGECNCTCEYGSVEVEKQDMDSSTTSTVEENHDQDQETEDMADHSADLNIVREEHHEVDCVEEQGTDQDENLMDDNNVSNMAEEEEEEEEEEDYSVLLRNDHLDILSTIRSYLNTETIATSEPDVLKEIEAAVKINRLIDDHVSAVDKCPICLQGFLTGAEIATMPCSHVFHCDCISEWLPKNNSCPLCRSLCATIVYI